LVRLACPLEGWLLQVIRCSDQMPRSGAD